MAMLVLTSPAVPVLTISFEKEPRSRISYQEVVQRAATPSQQPGMRAKPIEMAKIVLLIGVRWFQWLLTA